MTLPRYAPDIPLPDAPHLPGTGRPASDFNLPSSAIPRDLTPEVFAHCVAVDLHNRGFWWEAHEVWERPWRAQPRNSTARHLFQGLIQLAAAHLKWRQGLIRGRRNLGERALGHLRYAAADWPEAQGHRWGLHPRPVAAAYAHWLAHGPAAADRETLLAGMPPLLLQWPLTDSSRR